MKNLIILFLLIPSLVLAVDDATVQAIDSKASNAKAKADGNNSRIQALEAEDVILHNLLNNIQLTPGPAGPQGVAGTDGLTGAKGDTGDTGSQGIQGEQGPQGVTGTDGLPGPQGLPGTDGTQGAIGPAGPQGPAGADGASSALVNGVCSLYQRMSFSAPSSLISESPEASCYDSIDNDCDGFTDFPDDSDCYLPEICDDVIDNDADGLLDCSDPDCNLSLACGCIPDALEPNETFGSAHDHGTLTDTLANILTLTGNIAPDGDRDWYTFIAQDAPEGDYITDSYRVKVEFTSNPGLQFRIRVVKGDVSNIVCQEGGPYGSGSCNGNAIQYVESSYEVLDTQNDTARFFVEVVRSSGFTPTCDSYTLNVSNGL